MERSVVQEVEVGQEGQEQLFKVVYDGDMEKFCPKKLIQSTSDQDPWKDI